MCLVSSTLFLWLPGFPPEAFPSTDFLHSVLLGHLPSAAVLILGFLSNPHGSSIQPPWSSVALRPCSRYISLWHRLSVWFHSIWTVTDQLLHSPKALNASLLPNQLPRMLGSLPCFSSLTPWCKLILLAFPPPSILHPIEFCMNL